MAVVKVTTAIHRVSFLLLVGEALARIAAFPLSTVECLAKAEDSQQLCMLKNVAVWQGKIYVICEGSIELPDLSTTSWLPFAASHRIQEYVSVVSPKEVPFNHVSTVSSHSHAVLHQASLPSNHAHNMLETLPALFNRLCSFFDMCDYHDPRVRGIGGLLLLWVDHMPPNTVLRSMFDMIACISNRQIAMAETQGNEVLLVEELMVGFPTEEACQSDPLCHRYNNFTSLELTAHRVRFTRQCVGLAPEAPFREQGHNQPHVLFINRQHKAGRSILTLAEAMNHFANDGAEQGATCRLAYMEKLTLQQQAELLNWADIIVLPHGATFGNIVFAARSSVIVHVSASAGHLEFNENYIHIFDGVLNLSSIAVQTAVIGGVDIISEKVLGEDSPLKRWTHGQVVELITTGACPKGDTFCSGGDNVNSRLGNYAVPLEALVHQVGKAMHLWRQLHR